MIERRKLLKFFGIGIVTGPLIASTTDWTAPLYPEPLQPGYNPAYREYYVAILRDTFDGDPSIFDNWPAECRKVSQLAVDRKMRELPAHAKIIGDSQHVHVRYDLAGSPYQLTRIIRVQV